MKKLFAVIIIAAAVNQSRGQELPYKNPKLSVEKRVEDLLSRMTLKEKFFQLYMVPDDLSDGVKKYKDGIFGLQLDTKGKSANAAEQMLQYENTGSAESEAEEINKIQKYFVEDTRLGIPIIPFDEALHGLIRQGAIAFPEAIGLAATWDVPLMKETARDIAAEVRSRGIRQVLSPVINIARDVRWGRTEETYGEDPFLTTQMGTAFVSEFQHEGVIATPKHFVANIGAGGRDSYPINYNQRLLDQIYFPAFKAAVQKANSTSIMISYNSLDGTPCSANNWLLTEKLKKDWGFKGFVISDAGAIGGAVDLHSTAGNYAEATAKAINAGLDVILQTSYSQYPIFYEAFKDGLIKKSRIDDAVRRVLTAKFKLGLFENPYVNVDDAKKLNDSMEHRELAEKAAEESIVLLKNENNVLPLRKDLKTIAVIGRDAVEGRLGGYSRPNGNVINILDGIKEKVKDFANVKYSPGCPRENVDFIPVPPENLVSTGNGKKEEGLSGEYFDNPKFEGAPAFTRLDKTIDFRWTLFSPDPKKLDFDWYSVKWEGEIIGPKDGKVNIGIEGNDGYRLYINDKMIIDDWIQRSYGRLTVPYEFQKGKEYNIKIEFYTTAGNARFKLIWDNGVSSDWQQEIDNAVQTAKESDAAIITAGIYEGEFHDRAILSLPGHQEDLIKAVAETGVPTIVVLVGGSAITMSDWIKEVPGIIDVWYPGEMGGNAVANVLFGDYDPAGRLPITFPVFEGQLPLYYNHEPTGRGDDYGDLTGQPLFPFGYGLSYTKFEYSYLTISNKEITSSKNFEVRFKIKNTGKIDGDEVAELYIKDLVASVAQPVIELKGFKRIHLNPGESKEVEFTVTPQMLSLVDKDLNRVVEPGDFRIMIGASSKDIRLRGRITVK
jgi:beta-glucosidase